jgi:hypothetical protein
MTNSAEKSINLFIKSIVNENYADAKSHLQDVVVEKIKDRIRVCESKFNKKDAQ